MKKLLFAVFLFAISFAFSQSQNKVTFEQVMKSRDPEFIADYIKNNPKDPMIPVVEQRLIVYRRATYGEVVAKPKPKSLNYKIGNGPKSPSKDNKTNSDAKNSNTSSSGDEEDQTAQILNHMFSNDPASKEAYMQIENKSGCNLNIKISGKKNYTLNVPAYKKNYILLEKGKYTISTTVCNVKYSSSKSITNDVTITLNAPK